MQRRKLWIGIGVGILVAFILGIGGFLLWASNPSQAMPEALISLESDETIQVELDPWITFVPKDQQPNTGFIFYPGGLVEAAAYAPPLRAIAEAGYLTVITPMPLNLAVFDSGVAAEVISAHPEIETWVIGGHSLGGSMAASFSDQNPNIAGLVFWASYPAESNDLSGKPILVSSIYGTLDGLATPEKVLAAQPLLPFGTNWVPIEGGNHAQFGWYGPQDGDNPAAISHSEQQEQVVLATLELFTSLENSNE